jgi:hypothetical protein
MPLQSRRRFLTNAALAGAAGLGGLGAWGKPLAAEPPPEITTIRFEKDVATCIAPQVFQELLLAEGLTDIRYVELTEAHLRRAEATHSGVISGMIVQGEVDFVRDFAAYPYPAKAGSPTVAGRRRTWAAPAGMTPAVSWS